MRDLLPELARLRGSSSGAGGAGGAVVGRAVVIDVKGSAPRPPGAVLLATADGRFAGSLAGGCVESASVDDVAAAVRTGKTSLVSQGLDAREAWGTGLACGGVLRVLVEPAVRPEIEALAGSDAGGVVATVVAGPGGPGAAVAIGADGVAGPVLPALGASSASSPHAALVAAIGEVRAAAVAAFAAGESRCARFVTSAGEIEVFLEVLPPPVAVFVYGATDVAAALVRLAEPLGWRVTVADARAAFLVAERFAGATRLIRAWPEQAMKDAQVGPATPVVVLTHDPKLDVPALACALRAGARYVGLLGSRRTQAARREALRAEGLPDAAIATIRGPVGLDIRGRTAAELALSIVAEIAAARRGASGRPLTDL